jgi:hypothetical protein
MNRPEYVMEQRSKYFHRPCGRCKGRVRLGRRYVLDPVLYEDGLPVVYHADCFRVAVKKNERGV